MEAVSFQFGMGWKWISGILPIEIWHIADSRDYLASHVAVHYTERAWKKLLFLHELRPLSRFLM